MLKEELGQLCNLEKDRPRSTRSFSTLLLSEPTSEFSPAHDCELMKACMECDVARHKSLKARKVRQYIRRAFNLFDLLLLLLQRGAVQVQQCGGDANRKVAGVHLVRVSALQDVMKDADQMFQKSFIRPRKLVRYPGSKNGEGPLQKKGEQTEERTTDWRAFFFFPL